MLDLQDVRTGLGGLGVVVRVSAVWLVSSTS